MALTKVTYSMIQGAAINVFDYGAVGDGSTNDTSAIQAAIDAASSAGGGAVFFPSGTYIIGGSGNSIASREYGLLLKSNVALIGQSCVNTILKVKDLANIDLINTDRNSAQSNIQVSDLTFDGNEANQTEASVNGFNIWAYGITNFVIQNVKSINPKSWGIRIEQCDQVQINEITCHHSAESNSDGIHFVDTTNVTGGSIWIYTAGDDGFIIEALHKDVENYAMSGIYVTAPNGLGLPARGILLLGDPNVTSGAYSIKNVNLSACVIENAYGHGVCISGPSCQNVNINAVVKGGCSFAALYVGPGNSAYSGVVKNCSFNIVASDLTASGMLCVQTYGTISDNNINLLLSNPGDGYTGVNVQGDRWSGFIKVDYDPNGTKVDKKTGVSISGDYNNLNVSCKDSLNNLFLQGTAQNNSFTLGTLSGGSTSDLTISGGATGNTFTGGLINGTIVNSGGSTNSFSNVVGATVKKLATINMATLGTGSANIAHTLKLAPTNVQLTDYIGATSSIFFRVLSVDATNIVVELRDTTGTLITTGTYNLYVSASI